VTCTDFLAPCGRPIGVSVVVSQVRAAGSLLPETTMSRLPTRPIATDHWISARPQAAPAHVPAQPSGYSGETGSAAFYTSTCSMG
jgi:hypothetical protein